MTLSTESVLKTESTININRDWCKGCGICVFFCPQKVLGLDGEGKAIVLNPEDCIACGMCELRCPDVAIEILKEGT